MMKNVKIVMMAIVLSLSASAHAQGYFSENMFNHFAVGVTAGTPGFGFDVATTVGNHFQLRAGFVTFPNVKLSTSLNTDALSGASYPDINKDIDVEGKLDMNNFKLLIDYFPFKSSSFHVTAGAYIGSSKIVKVYNKEDGALIDITQYNNTVTEDKQAGLALGDYLLKPDDKGNVEGSIKVSAFKPYLGIGFGRAVPRKNRVGFMFELGCQFWGAPGVYTFDRKLSSDDLGKNDGGAIKTISKVSVYPVINFRLCGRIL
jgi:hypothetical protein